MPGLNGHANLALGLEACDAWSVTCARIHNHEWAFDRIDGHGLGWDDAREDVIDRSLELTAIQNHLGLHAQDVWCLFAHMALILVAALAHDVSRQYATLPGVNGIFHRRIDHGRQQGEGVFVLGGSLVVAHVLAHGFTPF